MTEFWAQGGRVRKLLIKFGPPERSYNSGCRRRAVSSSEILSGMRPEDTSQKGDRLRAGVRSGTMGAVVWLRSTIDFRPMRVS